MRAAGRSRALSFEEAAAFARDVQRRGGTVVYSNVVFYLIHPGHVRYLEAARALGNALIVGINTDRSVRANKGNSRPIVPEEERAELLLALRSVDATVIFDEPTPHAVISQVQPDVLVKGADWGPDNIVGRDVVEARGGRVVRMPLSDGFSTTDLIRRVRTGMTPP